MSDKFIGKWKSESAEHKDIVFDYQLFEWGDLKGRWMVEGDEIWLIHENKHDGTKWVFKFKSPHRLVLFTPEDFLYQRGGRYLYYQMSNPHQKIVFTRE